MGSLSREVKRATWLLVFSSCLTFLAKSSMSIQVLVETLIDGLLTHYCDAAFVTASSNRMKHLNFCFLFRRMTMMKECKNRNMKICDYFI